MSYTINKFNGTTLVVLEDGTIDTSTSIGLVGRNYVGYGETQNENFVFLLENFANNAPPARPLVGQTWFNSTENLLYVYDGSGWKIVGAAILSDTPPEGAAIGGIWLKTTDNTFYAWTGSTWTFIGPETVAGYGITRARSTTLLDSDGTPRPVILLTINNAIIGICSEAAFTVEPETAPSGFANLVAGVTLSSATKFKGTLEGLADRAIRLETLRNINTVPFDGTQNITIKASTTNKLIGGDYIVGPDFDGSTELTWNIDATPSNTIGTIVARNSQGGFAAGTITADLVGNVTGNVTVSTGTSTFNIIRADQVIGPTLRGHADTAIRLQTARKINGVNFDGSSDVTVTASAETLTGNYLNGTVLASSLVSVGRLLELFVANSGVTIGSGDQFKLVVDSSTPTIRSSTGELNFDMGASGPDISFVNATKSLSLGGPSAPAIIGDNTTNLGIVGYKFNNIYANNFRGNADTATLAVSATNLVGGGTGSIPYQTSTGSTSMFAIGAPGQYLRAGAANTLVWDDLQRENLSQGNYITAFSYNGSAARTISVDATSANTVNTVVARDSNGDFAARNITATLIGNVTGNAGSATQLQTPRTINGVAFNGTANITITATDPTKVPLAGGSMSGYLTLNANPVNPLHAAPKQYVDSRLPQYTFTYGQTYSQSGYTNQVGSWNFDANWFDIYPPAGKSMGNLVAFIPSIAVIHYAGGVDGNDSLVCTYTFFGDRIRVYVQNTEQRSTPAANWLVIWS
jgi:hypothetical protein